MAVPIRPLQLGKVTAYLEAGRAAMYSKANRRSPLEGIDFTRMTEVEYRAKLETENMSAGSIERELTMLRAYHARINTETVKDARRRLAIKKTVEAEEHLGDYLTAGRELKNRRGQKEIMQHGS